MKGIVFTEFIEMVEDKFSYDVADEIIENADLESGGVYTSVGSYDHHEIVQLVSNLSTSTDIAIPTLIHSYGFHLFGRFVEMYPHFFENVNGSLEFLAGVHDYIHVEVKKLYQDAELPTFLYEDVTQDSMVMIYQSSRPFADLAEGLIHGCIQHFNDNISVTREDLPGIPNTNARFTLQRLSK